MTKCTKYKHKHLHHTNSNFWCVDNINIESSTSVTRPIQTIYTRSGPRSRFPTTFWARCRRVVETRDSVSVKVFETRLTAQARVQPKLITFSTNDFLPSAFTTVLGSHMNRVVYIFANQTHTYSLTCTYSGFRTLPFSLRRSRSLTPREFVGHPVVGFGFTCHNLPVYFGCFWVDVFVNGVVVVVLQPVHLGIA